MSQYEIEVQGLTKKYGDRLAVNHITFNVKKGEILGFLGPNGAGKTTTMRMLTCFLPPDEGEAKICGFNIFENAHEIKKNIGYLPEVPPLYEEFLVAPYLDHVARLKGVPGKKRKNAVDVAMEKCGLTDVRGRLIANLSRGYKQRVGLAQALVHDPQVLILDEPTVGLDPNQIREIRTLIKNLKGDHTVILSTHILPEVSMTCDRIAIIHQGKIVAVDTYESLSSQLNKNDRIIVHVKKKDAGVKEEIQKLKGVKKVEENGHVFYVESNINEDLREKIADLVVSKGWGLLELKPEKMSLEDIFTRLTLEL